MQFYQPIHGQNVLVLQEFGLSMTLITSQQVTSDIHPQSRRWAVEVNGEVTKDKRKTKNTTKHDFTI